MTPLLDSKGTHEVKRSAYIGRAEFIIGLHADGTISFRQKGKRTEYRTSFGSAKNLAIIEQAMRDYEEKQKRYTERKKAGAKRIKQPRKPQLHHIFSPKYTHALKTKIS